jgi:hypothetical protein
MPIKTVLTYVSTARHLAAPLRSEGMQHAADNSAIEQQQLSQFALTSSFCPLLYVCQCKGTYAEGLLPLLLKPHMGLQILMLKAWAELLASTDTTSDTSFWALAGVHGMDWSYNGTVPPATS